MRSKAENPTSRLLRLKSSPQVLLSSSLPPSFADSLPTRLHEVGLSRREIRLIRLFPSEDYELPMEVELVVVDLDNAPPFEALSYVWGEQILNCAIRYNGESLWITRNLRDALARLRLRTTIRTVWADALCINQIYNQEKNHQTPLIDKIYSSAEKVVVWLGESIVDEAVRAARSVRLISHAQRARGGLAPSNAEVYFEDIAWLPLRRLYSRPWFERLWCVQEILLAQGAVLLWGEEELSWINVGLTANWLYKRYAEGDFLGLRFLRWLTTLQQKPCSTSVVFDNHESKPSASTDRRKRVTLETKCMVFLA